jgi:TetR/AcrR family transcriptional regulator, repressor for uid operon
MARPYLSAAIRRRQVLQQAAEAFAENGFHGTSTEDLCRATDLSPGGLFRLFPTKHALAVAIVAADAGASIERLQAAVQAACDPAAAMEAFVRGQLSDLDDPHARNLRIEIVAESTRSPDIAAAATAHDDAHLALSQSVIRAAARPGSDAETDPVMVAELIAVLVDGVATRSAVMGRLDPGHVDLVVWMARTITGIR